MEHEHGCGRSLKDVSHFREAYSPKKPKVKYCLTTNKLSILKHILLVRGLLSSAWFDLVSADFSEIDPAGLKKWNLEDSNTHRLKLS
ncbi:hypothetical protein AVEN_186782-1 [Araneus ventricosus]|uniref:Uncharacterized protein n=1 Tax=Araneus ventricosus TaxID=182803 RepID=A0A4Y2UQS3_ARAVE|nr:hypothetical protein AVEN_186782-1 [Araneus ventricosus]